VFFIQDDHDYFDNDEATDEIITFPPSYFMLQLARATQQMYYPEHLPDAARPRGLPWSASGDRGDGVSECFGTIRYGRLAEVLLYDVRRTMTLAGPSAVYVDLEAEKWLKARMAATEVAHVVHAAQSEFHAPCHIPNRGTIEYRCANARAVRLWRRLAMLRSIFAPNFASPFRKADCRRRYAFPNRDLSHLPS